ncbi:unnamed protein product, partial [Protopolystoma xenopodis]
MEIKSGMSSIQAFISHQKDINGFAYVFYYNLVDVLEVKDNIGDLLSRISAMNIQLDITINSDITRLYLDLISNYFALMFFLTRIPDIKCILILYNFLYEQANGRQEPNYPRMAELFTSSPEVVLRNLSLEVNPHARILSGALRSLGDFFVRRTVRAQNWSYGNFLNILSEPSKLTHTLLSDQLACELIPYEIMERWIVFGYLMIYPELSSDDAFNQLKMTLRNTYVVVLFRDDVIHIHSLLQTFLESVWTCKIGSKRVSEIKETFITACSQAPEVHADRRAYLRNALRQLNLIFADEPGLLGPKAFLVFWSLSYASDELHWLIRHIANPPNKKSGISSGGSGLSKSEDLIDPFLPELLFYMDELRGLILRH